eukprot:CAMPEP_0196782270 /NCGR_PEP_ID=MMETSP1104-20130614/11184_1 /TAXON_ID=33652 /ORGANISM="Cafeteria sp., Strain Caron Lab Isolate" /LENGTH=147 /DNA_ID=CAMNT_0042152503 /DNA_START=105 /DNA_END=548 /DNA_ORIENTATION=-
MRLWSTGYAQVRHTLDDEERRFQRSLEQTAGDEIDDLFRFESEDGDIEFDQAELEQLRMLEDYRDNLTSGGGARAGVAGQRAPKSAGQGRRERKEEAPRGPGPRSGDPLTNGEAPVIEEVVQPGPGDADHQQEAEVRTSEEDAATRV